MSVSWPPRPRNAPCRNSQNSAWVFSPACCQASQLLLSFQMLVSWISLGSWGRHRILIRSHLGWRRAFLRMLFVSMPLLTAFHLYWRACHSESKIALSCLGVVLLLERPASSSCLLLMTWWEGFCSNQSVVLSYRWDLHLLFIPLCWNSFSAARQHFHFDTSSLSASCSSFPFLTCLCGPQENEAMFNFHWRCHYYWVWNYFCFQIRHCRRTRFSNHQSPRIHFSMISLS